MITEKKFANESGHKATEHNRTDSLNRPFNHELAALARSDNLSHAFEKLRDSLRRSGDDVHHEHMHKIDRLIMGVKDMLSADNAEDMKFEAKKVEAEIIRQRICGLSGIIAPIIGLATVFVSTSMTPDFSWKDNALSHITLTKNHKYFMAGLGAAGALSTLFAYGLYAKKNMTPYERACAVVFGACGLLLSTTVSIKEKDGNGHNKPEHFIPAIGYFALGPLALISMGGEMMTQKGKKNAGIATASAGVLALAAILSKQDVNKIAITETLEAAILGGWAIAAAFGLLKESAAGGKIAGNLPSQGTPKAA